RPDSEAHREFDPRVMVNRNTKILVTGAAGFLGNHLCGLLVENGAEVFAVSRSSRRTVTKHWHWLEADCADGASAREIFKKVKPDVVFHLSGFASAAHAL